MKHIVDLTCCRAVFAGWVFAYHLNLQAHYASFLGPGGSVVQSGSLGVDGFFILSGMILAHAHPALMPTRGEVRQFWLKRLVRIYPVHIAMIAAMVAMVGVAALLGLAPRDPSRFSLDELVSHLALLHAWGLSDRWAWNYPSWSISAEWAGYLLFPFLWTMLRRQNGNGLAIVLPFTLLGVVACRELGRMSDMSLTFDGGVLRLLPEFVAGMCIIPLLPVIERRVPGRVLALAGVVLAVAGTLLSGPLDPAASITIVGLWAVLAGLLLAGRQGRSPVLGHMPALAWLGEVSYSYYMSFALVETVQATIWRHFGVESWQRPVLYIVTTTALTLATATATWWLVERPALRAFAFYTRRQDRRSPVAVRG